jgi:tetratricopeptide (TPR) repeat protein
MDIMTPAADSSVSRGDQISLPNQRHAVIIGVNGAPAIATDLLPLKYAADDALAIADMLLSTSCGFNVKPFINQDATASNIRQHLITTLRKSTVDDTLLIVFSCHAEPITTKKYNDDIFFVTHDYTREQAEDDPDGLISLRWLREYVYGHDTAARLLIVLDCCFGGNFEIASEMLDMTFRAIMDRYDRDIRMTNDSQRGHMRAIIAAAGYNQRAHEQEGHGQLIGALLNVLQGLIPDTRDELGRVTLARLIAYLEKPDLFPNGQRPVPKGIFSETYVLATFAVNVQRALPAREQTKQERLRARFSLESEALRMRFKDGVGREHELKEIERRVAVVGTTGGFVSVWGVAGQGKSSLLAKFSDRQMSGITLAHFIRVEPGIDYQVELLRDLMAHIILAADLNEAYIANESLPSLRSYFPRVLTEAVADGREIVIVIDGLDQLAEGLGGVRDLSFLPTQLPAHVVFVLGTRPNEVLGYLRRLPNHREYQIPPLSLPDFSLLLARYQVHVGEETRTSLYNSAQANTLYMDLIARAVFTEPMAPPDTLMKRIGNDPAHLFAITLERLRQQHDLWRDAIRPLLGVMLVARTPLTLRALRAITKVDEGTLYTEVQRLGGFVVDDHLGRYALYHPKLRDYLQSDQTREGKSVYFGTDDLADRHDDLARWCAGGAGGLTAIWRDVPGDPLEQERRRYARLHYIFHLYSARRWTLLWEALDQQSTYSRGKLQFDSSMQTYLLDLNIGRQAAADPAWEFDDAVAQLPRLWLYSYQRCQMSGIVDTYPSVLFAAMIAIGRPQDAARCASALSNSRQRLEILLLIAQSLIAQANREAQGQDVLLSIEEQIALLPNEEERTIMLTMLVEVLVRQSQFGDAERVLSQIEDPGQRAGSQVVLVEALAQAAQWDSAESLAAEIDEPERSQAQDRIARALARSGQWQHAQRVASAINSSDSRANALQVLVEQLLAAERWTEAAVQAQAIPIVDVRVTALRDVVIGLAAHGQFEEARRISLTVSPEQRDSLIGPLIPELLREENYDTAEDLLSHMLPLAEDLLSHMLPLSDQRGPAMASIAEAHLIAGDTPRALELAFSGQTIEQRTTVLLTLLRALADRGDWNQADALLRLNHDVSAYHNGLRIVASAAIKQGQWERAIQVAALGDMALHEEIGTLLVPALALNGQWEEAVQQARVLTRPEAVPIVSLNAARTLSALSRTLIGAAQLRQAEQIIPLIGDPALRAASLTTLAAAEMGRGDAELAQRRLNEAVTIVRDIPNALTRSTAAQQIISALATKRTWQSAIELNQQLADIANESAGMRRIVEALASASLWDDALAVVDRLDIQSRREMRIDLGQRMAQDGDYERAEQIVTSLSDPTDVTEILIAIVRCHIAAARWHQAEKVATALPQVRNRTEVLAEIALNLAQSGRPDQAHIVFEHALRAARQHDEPRYHDYLQRASVELLAGSLELPRIETIIASISNPLLQTIARCSVMLAAASDEPQLRIATAALIDDSAPEPSPDNMLQFVMEELAHTESLDIAYDVAVHIGDKLLRVYALSRLALLHSATLETRIIPTLTQSIQDLNDETLEPFWCDTIRCAAAEGLAACGAWELTLATAAEIGDAILQTQTYINLLALSWRHLDIRQRLQKGFTEALARIDDHTTRGQAEQLFQLEQLVSIPTRDTWTNAITLVAQMGTLDIHLTIDVIVLALAMRGWAAQSLDMALAAHQYGRDTLPLLRLTRLLVYQHRTNLVLLCVQRSWSHIATPSEAISLLPLAKSLIAHNNAVAIDFADVVQLIAHVDRD